MILLAKACNMIHVVLFSLQIILIYFLGNIFSIMQFLCFAYNGKQ